MNDSDVLGTDNDNSSSTRPWSNHNLINYVISPASSFLPDEMVSMILHYANAGDLLHWRTVSRVWNQMACENLRHSLKIPIKFTSDGDIDEFVALMRRKVQQRFLLPFSAFEFKLFFCSSETVNTFLNAGHGPAVTRLILHVDEDQYAQSVQNLLLSSSPNLKMLQFITEPYTGSSEDECNLLKLNTPLPQLRSLIVPKPLQSRLGSGKLGLDVLQNWIKLAPALTEFQCHLRLKLHSEDDHHFPQVLYSMSHIPVIGIRLSISTHPSVTPYLRELIGMAGAIRIVTLKLKMADELSVNTDNLSLACEWVDTLSGTLKTLALAPNDAEDMRLGLSSIYPHLESIELDYAQIYHENRVFRPFEPHQFPVLKTIKIMGLKQSVPHRNFANCNENFPSVQTLYLKRYNLSLNPLAAGVEHFSLLFPNLRTLKVFIEDIRQDQVCCIISNFRNLVHLRIGSLRVPDKGKGYFEFLTGGLRQSQINWRNNDAEESISLKTGVRPTDSVLAQFKNLKSLEIVGKNLNTIFLAILYLTAVEEMPMLESLILRGVHRDGNRIAYRSLARYNWHKRISIRTAMELSDDSDSDDDGFLI